MSRTMSSPASLLAPPARTFGPRGPTLGELSDAYLQDYPYGARKRPRRVNPRDNVGNGRV